MAGSTWFGLASNTSAVAVAREVAFRLQDHERVNQAIALASRQTSFPSTTNWRASSLPWGNAGLATFFAALDTCFPEERWDQEGHRHLLLAAQALAEHPLEASGLGLWGGACGVAYSALLLSRQGTRYQRLLATLDDEITSRLNARIVCVFEQRHGFASHQYDLISGLVGSGAYLLCRRSQPKTAEALHAVLRAVIFLSEEVQEIPRWYTPPALIIQPQWQSAYPKGLFDCGLAHGIAGLLSLLALSKLQGLELEGMDDALGRMGRWLTIHCVNDAWGINWPTVYPAGPPETAQNPLLAARTAWCYGAPGIARALWLAGESLREEAYQGLACSAMEAVYRRPHSARNIDSPTFCHGIAGLLQITLRFAQETGLPLFQDAAQALTQQLLAQYEPESLLGFRDLEPSGISVDQAGLLTGAPGAALVLLSAGTNAEPNWDRLFLLS